MSGVYKNFCISSISLFLPLFTYGASSMQPTFSGNRLSVQQIEPEKNTGLDRIFVLYETEGVEMFLPASDPSTAKLYRYSNLGGGYAEEINDVARVQDGVILKDIQGNLGYIFEDGTDRYYFWIVAYHAYRFSIESIMASPMQDCDATLLDVVGKADPIHYYTINGQQRELSRDIIVTFDTQRFDSETNSYVNVSKKVTIASFNNTIRISPASLAYTSFHITGDRFLKAWKWNSEAESIVIPPNAVAITTSVEQLDKNIPPSDSDDEDSVDNPENQESEASNIIKGDDTQLGGSAPADISFNAYVSDGVLHYEWQMSKDPEFVTVDYRFNVQELDYTFLEEGTYYVRFIGSNSDGSCEAVSDTYTVTIGSSELLCPNAFSPDGDGVNDVWKISYRSLIEFECWIFDRYGNQVYHYTDPQGGWDGKRGGKEVKPGVYYYVITATGADGKKYKKSGDINILRRRSLGVSDGSETE